VAAKTIQEAVELGTKGLLADTDTLVKELRDFFAHKTIKVDGQAAKVGRQATAIELFEEVFRDISAMKGTKNE